MKKGTSTHTLKPIKQVVDLLNKKDLLCTEIIQDEQKNHNIYKVFSSERNKSFFLKVSRNKKASLLLNNQYVWSKQIASKIPENAQFLVPMIIDHGFINDQYFWLLTEYIQGVPFAKFQGTVSKIQVSNPESYLEKIANLIKFLQVIEIKGLSGIDTRLGKLQNTSRLAMLEKSISMSRNFTPFLADQLQIINSNYHDLGRATNHCDITDINLIVTSDDKIALIDAELGGAVSFRYYDVAEFYNRIYTRACRPDLAKTFLKLFIKKLKKSQKIKFLNNFLCLCALRSIGNFSEIGSLGKTSWNKRIKFARQFAYEIVTHEIIIY